MPTSGHSTAVKNLLKRMGANPDGGPWLEPALVHSSWVNETLASSRRKLESNERLEFLGDAVLGLVIARRLCERLPHHQEGDLSKAKAHLVSTEILARYARELGLGEVLLLGRGEEKSGGRERDSNLANALEAILGAWFLAEGLEAPAQLVDSLWKPEIEQQAAGPGDSDYKSQLQELSQKLTGELPEYKVESITGPDHGRIYEIEVMISGKPYGRGTGRSKKEAARAAAAAALTALKKCKKVLSE